MMNRELRRAQKKQDEKFDKEREKRRDKRKAKVASLREQRSKRRQAAAARAEARKRGEAPPKEAVKEAAKDQAAAQAATAKGKRPGRFSLVLMMVTVFFIVLQGAIPLEQADEVDVLRSLTGAGFYLLFAYFSTLWLMRRGAPKPILMTIISGGMLTLGVEVARRFQPELTTDWLMVVLAPPFIVAGAFLGRLVYINSPR